MKDKNIFKITIEALDDKSGDVDLDVCIQQLTHLEKALKKTAKKISQQKPVKFKITKASKNSPFNAEIAIEWDDINDQNHLITNIKSDLKAIKYGHIKESNLEYDILQEYKKISKFYSRKDDRYKTTIDFFDSEVTTFDADFTKNIDSFFRENDNCIASYEGELEQINLHNGINYFYIYPYGLPEKIKCSFPQELCDIAIDGIGRKVCITGDAIYTQNQQFPHVINVKEIDVYSPEIDLPTWNDLLGIAPDATGELLSEEFVRRLRNEW